MKKKRYFSSLLFKYIKGQKQIMILLSVFFVANIVLQVISPQVLSYFIDSAESGKTFLFVSMIVLAYLVTIILNMIAEVCQSYFAQNFGWRVNNSFRKDVMAHFIKIDMEHHEKWTSGESITRLDEDVEGLFKYFYILIFNLTSSVLLMVGVLIVLANKNIILAFAMFVFCITSIWVFKAIQDYGAKFYVKRSKAISKFNGFVKERIDNVVEIHANSAEEYSIYSLKVAMNKLFKKSFPAGMMYSILWSASTILDAIVTVLSLGIAILLWDKNIITVGTVYLIYAYTKLIYGPLQEFRNNIRKLQEAKASLVRVKEMLDIETNIAEGNIDIKLKDITLTVKDLYFKYTENDYVLNNISFELKSGERLGIMGETGCGKTTLAKVLARLYEFNRGEILLNGTSIKEIKGESLNHTIAYCTQDVQLLHGTLRDNITLYNKDFSDEMIYNAIKQMGLNEWFYKFYKGLDTPLKMGENNLSAGEAQLISIIRIFLKDPAIVILDEISSRLDYVTEQRILSAIDVLTENRTVISIAHKHTAMRWSDKIMILDNGRITKYIRKEELDKNSTKKVRN